MMKRLLATICLLSVFVVCACFGATAKGYADTTVAVIGDAEYSSLQEAVEAYEGTMIRLIKTEERPVNIQKNIYLDLNGCNVTGAVTVDAAATLYCKDTATDDFRITDGVYGKLANVSGNVEGIPEASSQAEDGYLMLTENDGISFHRVDLQLTAITLRTVAQEVCAPSVYYQCSFKGDEMVADAVQSYGVALNTQKMPDAHNVETLCAYSWFTQFAPGAEGNEKSGTLLYGIMKPTNETLVNNRNANLPIYGKAYIQTAEGYLFGGGQCRTLKQVTEAADDNWAQYTDVQKQSLQQMYNAYEPVMKSWDLRNINNTQNVEGLELYTVDLTVNNLDTPIGVDTTPIFSWVNQSKRTGRAQTAYQIIVASTKELAEAHTGDLWDTGKVTSDQSFDISYAGQALASRMDCYWAVRVWDETDTASQWSDIARFGVGILEQSDWTAKWIGAPTYTGGTAVIPAPMLRKAFTLDSNIKNAKIYICGLGLFELKVNGLIPDDSVLNPADTQYEDTVSYCAYDVTHLLRQGSNAMTVELGCGFYNLSTDISVGFVNGVWKDDPKLLLELHVEYEDGSKKVIISDESWRCYEDGPIRSDNIYCGEIYDANKEVQGWTEADFDDSSWQNVRLATAPTGKLKYENMEPMRRVRSFMPTVEQLDENTWLVYAPEYCTGWASISFPNAKKGENIRIRYFQRDYERKNGLILTEGDEVYQLQSYTYCAKGVPGETYEPKFSYAGYEIIEITGYTGQLQPEDIVCYTVASDVEHIGQFTSGNVMVNKLHEAMVRTMVCNMQGKPTDTPIFEKLGWTGDYNGAIKTFNYNFDVSNFLGHFLYNLRDTGGADGHLIEFSPSGHGSGYLAPVWTQMYVNSIYAAWHENGQLSLVQEHYDYMRTNADYYISKINGGAEPWIWESTEFGPASGQANLLGDWAAPANGSAPTAPPEGGSLYNTAAVYRVMREMTEICTAMGDLDAAQKYKTAADNIQNNFNRVYYNAEKGYYETDYRSETQSFEVRSEYRQALNLVALHMGFTTEENHDIVLNNLVEDIRKKNNHADVGSVGAELILPVLTNEGYHDLALEVLLQTDYPSWGGWIVSGSNTCLEGWKTTNRSFCHYFLGTYDEWFYQNLGGIQNPRDGYKTVTICPEIYPDLRFVNTSVDTVRGKLVSNWKVDEDNRVTMTVTVPIGTTADLLLPVSEGHEVQMNGAPLALQDGVLEIGTGGNRILVRLTGGTFHFDLGTEALTEGDF